MKSKIPLLDDLKIEYQHLGNFYPVALIIGILAAAQGISPWIILCGGGMGMCALLFRQTRQVGILLILSALGFALMCHREEVNNSPVLQNPVQVELQGFVEESHLTPQGEKIILSHISLLNRYDLPVPEKIKLYQGKDSDLLPDKAWVKVRAFIWPPFSKINAVGYDEAYALQFQKIGAIGQVQEVLSVQKTSRDSVIDRIRKAIAHNIRKAVPPEVAEVLIPLSIGDQSGVSQRTYDLFRSGGITHILSVSGFHLSLLAFFIFLIIRRLLALSPKAEYISTKKIAAVLALLGATGYILISGMQVPAIRSLIMIAIVLLAVLWDRNALSVRSLSVAALVILFFCPELVFNVSFQLSFMAVLVLTTLYPQVRCYIWPLEKPTFVGRFCRYILSFITIDFLIGLATTPFIIYHFNRYALYSPIGNVLMGTLISFWVMPLLFLALLIMPFGSGAFLLNLSGLGIEYVLSLCSKIHEWPYAITIFPSFSADALMIMTTGILLLCLLKTRLRIIGICVLMLGMIMACLSRKPDLMIGDFGQTVALRTDRGLVFIAKGPKDYTAQNWLLQNGEEPEQNIPSVRLPDSFTFKGYLISFNEETCGRADICFLDTPAPKQDKVYPLYEKAVKLVYFEHGKIRVQRLERKP